MGCSGRAKDRALTREIQQFSDDLGAAVDLGRDHLRELLNAFVRLRFGRVNDAAVQVVPGVADRCQGVPQFVTDAGREAPDRRQLLRAHERFLSLTEAIFGVLDVGDVEGDALNEQRATVFVTHDTGLPVDPDRAPIAREEPAIRPKRAAYGAAARKLGVPAALVFGVHAVKPEHRIVEPLLLGVTEQGLNLWTNVELVFAVLERGHEGHRWDLL